MFLFFERKVAGGSAYSLKIESKFLVKIYPELPMPGGVRPPEHTRWKEHRKKKVPKAVNTTTQTQNPPCLLCTCLVYISFVGDLWWHEAGMLEDAAISFFPNVDSIEGFSSGYSLQFFTIRDTIWSYGHKCRKLDQPFLSITALLRQLPILVGADCLC